MSALDDLKEKARQESGGAAPQSPAPEPEAKETPEKLKTPSAAAVKNAAIKTILDWFTGLDLAAKSRLPSDVQSAVKTLLHKKTGKSTIFQKLFPAPAEGQAVDGKKIYEVFEGDKSVPECMRYFRKFNESQKEWEVFFNTDAKVFELRAGK